MPTCKAYLLRMLACKYNKWVLIGAHNVESNNPTDKKSVTIDWPHMMKKTTK